MCTFNDQTWATFKVSVIKYSFVRILINICREKMQESTLRLMKIRANNTTAIAHVRLSTHKYSLGSSHEMMQWLIVHNGTKPWTSLWFFSASKVWHMNHHHHLNVCAFSTQLNAKPDKWIFASAFCSLAHTRIRRLHSRPIRTSNHLTESKMIIKQFPVLLLLKCQHYNYD